MKIFRRNQGIRAIRRCAAALIDITGYVNGLRCRAEIPSTRTAGACGVYKESPTQFKENEGWTVAQPADSKLHGKWWEIFNDPELNALEEQLDN